MKRIAISMMCCLIVLGCQDGVKIVESVPTKSIPPLDDGTVMAQIPVETTTGWLPIGAYLLLLGIVGWLTWREFRGSIAKSNRS
tara:strand:- start:114 stop:365 length:252 start_codon:yes stop_codon:yes gene_type:complete